MVLATIRQYLIVIGAPCCFSFSGVRTGKNGPPISACVKFTSLYVYVPLTPFKLVQSDGLAEHEISVPNGRRSPRKL